MNLQQLRFLAAIVQSDLNITAAARRLHTSQPGVSKQLRLFEEEVGVRVFEREGQNLLRITPAGSQLVRRALRILDEVTSIERLSADARNDTHGRLAIGTTHTQARYVLPAVFDRFRERFPDVQLELHQGTSEQIAGMVKLDQIDFALATGGHELFPKLLALPVYRWARRVVVPVGHPLAGTDKLTLAQLAEFPIVTYVFSLNGNSSLLRAFEATGLRPQISLTARDADVIKTYVRRGFGVGVIASMAYEADVDADLVSLDASHLFPQLTTWIGFNHGTLLRDFMFEFLAMLAPHLQRTAVERAIAARDPALVAEMFAAVPLPFR